MTALQPEGATAPCSLPIPTPSWCGPVRRPRGSPSRTFRDPLTSVHIAHLSVEQRAVLIRIAGFYRSRVLCPPPTSISSGWVWGYSWSSGTKGGKLRVHSLGSLNCLGTCQRLWIGVFIFIFIKYFFKHDVCATVCQNISSILLLGF